jgi:DNA-binding NarL/FixJ family response regulator
LEKAINKLSYTQMNDLKVVLLEDNNSLTESLKILIDGTEGYSFVGAFADCRSMLKNIKNLNANVLLIDIALPGMSCIKCIKEVKTIYPDLAILVLTVHEEDDLVFDAICAGACGYLVKTTPASRLLEAIKEACEGGAPMSSNITRKVIDYFQKRKPAQNKQPAYDLTSREQQILVGLVEGNNFKAIADSLFISKETVRFHFRNIYKKLHVHSQSEAVAKAIKESLI